MLISLKRTLFLTCLMSFAAYTEEMLTTPLNSLRTEPILSRPQSSPSGSLKGALLDKTLELEDLKNRLTTVQDNLTREARNGNRAAQVCLIDAYQHNKYGFTLTRDNQRIILILLTEFAKNNSLLQPVLIKAYKDGKFGLSYKQQKTAKIGKNLALQYIESPKIGDLIIEAMKEERLTFKKRHNCLPLLMKLAFELKNNNAQVFLLECYITGQYGADFLNKKLFREIVEKLEFYAEPDTDLAALIVSIWQQNLLEIKDKKELKREQFRINERFSEQSFKNAKEKIFSIGIFY